MGTFCEYNKSRISRYGYKQTGPTARYVLKQQQNRNIMEKYVCEVCDWVYDPTIGDPEHGIEPGTAFEDLPDDWVCPLCGVGKDQFEPFK